MGHITIAAAGDISTGHEPPESAFIYVSELLRSADIRFAQVERVYTERGHWQEQAGIPRPRQHPRTAAAFKSVPFDVLSIASNNTGDWGPEGAEDTVRTFYELGIPTIGAGINISEARKPVILTRKDIRIAFLGYVSVTLPHYWATESRAGSVPMRARTFYEPSEFQPGAPAIVVTAPNENDLEKLVHDVRQAKRDADLVFVSLHWGVHHIVRPCDYQPVVAHAAIDAGATAILGHHPHQPQGVERYRGGVIFYSIGNFSMKPKTWGELPSFSNEEYTLKDIYTVEPDPGVVYNYRRHYNEGGVAFIDVDRDGLSRVAYVPTLMNAAGQPEIVRPDDPQFEKSLTYLNWAGKFIKGGVTQIKAAGDRYEIYARDDAVGQQRRHTAAAG